MSRVEQQQPGQRRGGGSAGGFDLKNGLVFGAGAWIVGVVLTGVLAWVEFRDATDALDRMGGSGEFSDFGGAAESLPSAVDFVGWLFYNAHFVDVGLSVMGQGIWFNFVTASVNLTGQIAQMADDSGVTEMEQGLEMLLSTVPTPVWLLVPVVVLLATGYVVASRGGAYGASQGAKAGASITLGYFALAVGGTFLFSWSLSGGDMGMSFSVAPQLMKAAGVMGLAYPAVFGGIGGAIAGQVGDQPTGRHAGSAPRPPQSRAAQQQAGQQPAGRRGGQQPAGQGNQQPPADGRDSQQGQQRDRQGNLQPASRDEQSGRTGDGSEREGQRDGDRRTRDQ